MDVVPRVLCCSTVPLTGTLTWNLGMYASRLCVPNCKGQVWSSIRRNVGGTWFNQFGHVEQCLTQMKTCSGWSRCLTPFVYLHLFGTRCETTNASANRMLFDSLKASTHTVRAPWAPPSAGGPHGHTCSNSCRNNTSCWIEKPLLEQGRVGEY